MKIIIDAMGGDNAPGAIVKGAVMAARELDTEIVLVGQEEKVRACLAENGAENLPGISVVNASEVITMHDDPSTACRRKKDASMTVALNLLRDGEGDAVVSAGSTGALLTGATLIVKRIRGIRRAALGPVIPNPICGTVLMDCGANADCTAEYLLQFAFMGSFYAQKILGVEQPRVALLNVGTEDSKGGTLQHEAFELLKKADEDGRIHFIGNAEASELFSGRMDVLVADGFAGNILLKGVEGAAKYVLKLTKDVLSSGPKNRLAGAMVKKDLYNMRSAVDPNSVGGTALMGIRKPVIKAHGSSDEDAVLNAVRQAMACVQTDIVGAVVENIDYMKLNDDKGE